MGTESQIEPILGPKNDGEGKDTPKFIFPNIIAKGMANLTTQYQMEASMLSLVIILIGMIIMGIYSIFFTGINTFLKIMVGINGLAGMVFLSSFLVTQYQQYQSFMVAQKFKEEFFKNEN